MQGARGIGNVPCRPRILVDQAGNTARGKRDRQQPVVVQPNERCVLVTVAAMHDRALVRTATQIQRVHRRAVPGLGHHHRIARAREGPGAAIPDIEAHIVTAARLIFFRPRRQHREFAAIGRPGGAPESGRRFRALGDVAPFPRPARDQPHIIARRIGFVKGPAIDFSRPRRALHDHGCQLTVRRWRDTVDAVKIEHVIDRERAAACKHGRRRARRDDGHAQNNHYRTTVSEEQRSSKRNFRFHPAPPP